MSIRDEKKDRPESKAGRVFFSSTKRSLMEEDVVELTSVGVDIGSSTSHLAISKITLERLDSRYVIAGREVLHESDIALTPYHDTTTIDADALGGFIDNAFSVAGISPDDIDTGALILTGVAVRRQNARAVGELFAGQAGKFVAVSAGDSLETVMAAYGSGAVARSIREGRPVMNIDIGGGTSKIAVCDRGEVVTHTALDVGARLFVFDDDNRLLRIEEAGHRFAAECGFEFSPGDVLDADAKAALVARMGERLFETITNGPDLDAATRALLRLDPLAPVGTPDVITFSGGVGEFIYGNTERTFGDLGPELAADMVRRVRAWGPELAEGQQAIRATVIGASQYTVQVSGSTIYLSAPDVVPLNNIAVIAPTYDATAETLDENIIADAVRASLAKFDLHGGHQPVAVCLKWAGSATFGRLHAVGAGVVAGLGAVLQQGHPLVMVSDSDIGGLLGIHCHEEIGITNAIVSIDGIELKEFDFIDIGALLKQTGAVPVVIKSLVFPGEENTTENRAVSAGN